MLTVLRNKRRERNTKTSKERKEISVFILFLSLKKKEVFSQRFDSTESQLNCPDIFHYDNGKASNRSYIQKIIL